LGETTNRHASGHRRGFSCSPKPQHIVENWGFERHAKWSVAERSLAPRKQDLHPAGAEGPEWGHHWFPDGERKDFHDPVVDLDPGLPSVSKDRRLGILARVAFADQEAGALDFDGAVPLDDLGDLSPGDRQLESALAIAVALEVKPELRRQPSSVGSCEP